MENKTYNGWANWETWNFYLHEQEQLEMFLQDDMSLEDVHDVVWTHISILAENEETEALSGIAQDLLRMAFEQVDTDEIAEALFESLQG